MSFLFLSKITACGIVVPSFFCSGMYVAKDHSPFITNSSHQNTTLTKFTASLFCERMAVKSIVVLLCECNAERKWTDRSAEIRIHIHQQSIFDYSYSWCRSRELVKRRDDMMMWNEVQDCSGILLWRWPLIPSIFHKRCRWLLLHYSQH